MRLNRIAVLIALVMTYRQTAAGGQADEEAWTRTATPLARRIYLELAATAALPAADQAKQTPHIYRDVEAALAPITARVRFYSGPARFLKSPGESPQSVADRLTNAADWLNLYFAAEQERSEILKANVEVLTPLVRADLDSGDVEKQRMALATAGMVKMPALFDAVVALYLHPADAPPAEAAARVLLTLHDPRTLDRLLPLAVAPIPPQGYFQLLYSFTANRPAPPALLHLLGSPDIDRRRQALYALTPSGDPKLAPYLRYLILEKDSTLREEAGYAALALTGTAAKRLRPQILALLRDPDKLVRLNIACALAARKDLAAGPALLGLLRDTSYEEGWHSNAVQAMNNLAGSYFDYDFADWHPTTDHNRASIAQFANWVALHPAPKQ